MEGLCAFPVKPKDFEGFGSSRDHTEGLNEGLPYKLKKLEGLGLQGIRMEVWMEAFSSKMNDLKGLWGSRDSHYRFLVSELSGISILPTSLSASAAYPLELCACTAHSPLRHVNVGNHKEIPVRRPQKTFATLSLWKCIKT